MSLADVKNRVQAQMNTIAGMGNVYTRLRNLSVEKDQALLLKGGALHVWMIDRIASALIDQSVNQNFTEQRDALCITGYLGVNDANASSDTFEALIDAILQTLNNDRRPPSLLGNTVYTAQPPQLKTKDHHMYGVGGQVLCHHAEIVISFVWRELQ
jgi:hypothetical protein